MNLGTLIVLPPESGDQNVPTDEEADVRGTSLLPENYMLILKEIVQKTKMNTFYPE